MADPSYRSIAVAAAFSPRFEHVLSEARRVRDRFEADLSFIFVGKRTPGTVRKFADAWKKLALPADSVIHYEEGDPASGILGAAAKHQVELLVAGALEKEAVHRQFLGNVARRLVREAHCSVMLFTEPALEPRPLRHIVFMAEYSDHAREAFRRTLRLAERENCERLYVIRNYTTFDKARARRRAKTPQKVARTLEEEEVALQEFVLAAGATPVPVETRCIRGNTGFASSDFVQAVSADLLVVPLETKPGPEAKLPRQSAWVTDVIPCNLWIVR
jgi:nucleotide-binding universal stress UspA family protein